MSSFTQTTEPPMALAAIEGDPRNPYRDAARKLRARPMAMAGAIILVFFIVLAVFAPVIAPYDPNEISRDRRAAPTREHPFGTDELGRDVLSRVIHGARVSLRVGLIAVAIALVFGAVLGISAAYFGGWFDTVVMRVMDIMLAFPGILLAIAIIAILGPSLTNAMIAIGIEAIPVYTRTARASTLTVKELEYVVGAKALGSPAPRILFRHILPNITTPLIVLATVGVAGSILTAAGLSYLGLGAQPPTAEWGAMLSSSRSYLRDCWWMATFPGIAIVMVVLSLNLFGDGLRDMLDPRMRR
ncbi:MAG: ABC transporter permease [Thermomicrobiales bacterium]